MKTEWEYALPTDEYSNDYQYESPIFIKDNMIYFISNFKHQLQLHIIDGDSGLGRIENIPQGKQTIPSDFFFLEYKENIIFYTGDFYVYSQSEICKFTDLRTGREIHKKLTSYLLHEHRLLFSHTFNKDYLFCYNLDTMSLEWKLDISNTKPYRTGEITLFEDMVACYGDRELLFVDMEDGTIRDRIKVPRIDKLFHPIRVDAEHILIGYTNWTNAGILKYNTNSKKIVWRHKRKFEGPQLRCKIYSASDRVFWAKNTTELICLDMETGEELYSVKTNPWLYTDLFFIGDHLLYGTSGRDGYMNCVDIRSGEVIWSVFLRNGCAYFDVYNGTVLVGDFDKSIKQIATTDGSIRQDYQVDGEVVGDMKVCGDCAYTVIWGHEDTPIRLIKVRIGEGDGRESEKDTEKVEAVE